MIRRFSALALAFCLNSVSVYAQAPAAQGSQLTVNTASAEVHKFPTVASAVIGKAQRGMVLEIKRNLGSWVEVPWVGGDEGVAYLHVNSGSIAPRTSALSRAQLSSGNGSTTSMSSLPDNPAALSDRILAAGQANGQPHSNGSGYIVLPHRNVGLGARMNAATLGFGAGFGASARTWWANNLGLQFDVLHSRLPSLLGIGHVTSLQFAPSAVYSLPGAVTNTVWLRPYVGGGGIVYRTSFNSALANVESAGSEKGLGFQSFGGAETTFAGAPQFAVSAEVGYRWWQQISTVGVTPSKLGISLSGHWYVK
jgi:hypothetical protein